MLTGLDTHREIRCFCDAPLGEVPTDGDERFSDRDVHLILRSKMRFNGVKKGGVYLFRLPTFG